MKKRAPSREGMTVTTVAFHPKMYRQLSDISHNEQISLNELVRQAVQEWLDRRDARRKGRAKR